LKNDMLNGMTELGPQVPTREAYKDIIRDKMHTMMLEEALAGTALGIMGNSSTKPENLGTPLVENVPGWDTNKSWDFLNLHLHGFEVAPHLFWPMGNSNPTSPWITIEPTDANGQQCFCYRFAVADTMSKGFFIYHTHRHGTASMLTWSAMFGVAFTDTLSVAEASLPQAFPVSASNNQSSSMLANLVDFAAAENLSFDDADILPFVIFNVRWKYRGPAFSEENPTRPAALANSSSFESREVEVNGWLSNDLYNSINGKHDPYLVNNAWQPTLVARAGSMTLIRILCISADWVCAFQILDSNNNIVPFHAVASDGITYEKPVYHKSNGDASNLGPDHQSSEAYLELGAGQRQDIIVQFEDAGIYTVYQYTDMMGVQQQTLAFINVSSAATCGMPGQTCKNKNLEEHSFSAARAKIDPGRPIAKYRDISWVQQLNQSELPFVQWGMSSGPKGSKGFRAFNISSVDMRLTSGDCAIWTIRSQTAMPHPLHIHVNPFMIINVTTGSGPGVATAASNPSLQRASRPWVRKALIGQWHDTAMVPPFGTLTIKQCYDAGAPRYPGGPKIGFAGKFVFHCHFMVHEDTGLIHNVMLEPSQGEVDKIRAQSNLGRPRQLRGQPRQFNV